MKTTHNCPDHREYLSSCGDCPECKEDPRNCDLVVYGICRICGEIVKNDSSEELPILSNLEKRIILVLGQDLNEYEIPTRFTGHDIKHNLYRFNEKYHKPYRSHIPYSTLKHLIRKELVDTVMDTLNGRKITYYLLDEKGILWYEKATKIEHHIFQNLLNFFSICKNIKTIQDEKNEI